MKPENKLDEICLLKDVFVTSNSKKFLKIENSEVFNLKPYEKFTIAFWLKSKSTEAQTGAILAKMEHDLREYRGWDVSLYNEKESILGLHLINKYPESSIKVVSSKISYLLDGNWHHVAVVYNGHARSAGVKIFVDCKQVETKTEIDSLSGDIDNIHPITIGARSNGLFNFRGSLYDIRLIKGKLNQSEIAKLISEAEEIRVAGFHGKIELLQDRKILLRVKNVSRNFTIHHEKNIDVFSKLTSISLHRDKQEKLTVLDNISFELRKGEMLGILGRNGSGKTTLLKIIGKIMQPSSGKVEINGKISSFLFLGASFHPDLTAKQNVILYGMVLGKTKKDMEEKVDSIIRFAELESFADVKIRNFSTGMNMRLAFSTALSVDPDILLIDEVLAVGDLSFQQKSLEAFLKIKNSGKSVIFVSHNLDQLERFCDKLILLENGRVMDAGEPEDVISTYVKLMTGIDSTNINMSNP